MRPHVRTVQRGAPNLAPTAEYNAAGLLVRVPGGSAGNERWLMLNVGMQQASAVGPGVGREVKITTPAAPASHSVRYLLGGANEETLRICRVDDTLYVLRLVNGAWEEEVRTAAAMAISTGPTPIPTGTPVSFDATQFVTTLEAEIVAGNYLDSNDRASPFSTPAGGVYQTLGIFDYVRFGDAVDGGGCAAP